MQRPPTHTSRTSYVGLSGAHQGTFRIHDCDSVDRRIGLRDASQLAFQQLDARHVAVLQVLQDLLGC
ncbi:hypothetical protein D3C78_1436170 [compost metagenome]